MGPTRTPLMQPADFLRSETDHDPGDEPGSWSLRSVGSVVELFQLGPHDEGTGVRYLSRSFGRSDMTDRTFSSVSSPLKPRATLTLPPDHITTVTSAFLDSS